MNVSWTIAKNQILTKNIIPQIILIGETYYVILFDGPFKLECLVNKGTPECTDLETNILPLANKSLTASAQSPFASKTIGNKKLYKRGHGKIYALNNGINTIAFKIPYPWVKITGIQIIDGEALDTVNLYILDDAIGSYSGTPNQVLNQFAYDLNIAAGFYENKSEFDADLYFGMTIKIDYYSQTVKRIGLNFVLNEVK